MNSHIEENTTRNFNVFNRWSFWVTRCYFYNLLFTNFARSYSFFNCTEIMVKTTIETNLIFKTRCINNIKNFFDFINIMVNRFFTENMFTSLNSFYRKRRMHISRSTNENSLNIFISQYFFIICISFSNAKSVCPGIQR